MFRCPHAFGNPLISPDAPTPSYVQTPPSMSPMLPCASPICYFRITTPSQSRNCSKSVLLRPPHLLPYPPKVGTVQKQFFQGIDLTPPYVWGHLDTSICLDTPMHLHTILMPPIPHMFNTPLYISGM